MFLTVEQTLQTLPQPFFSINTECPTRRHPEGRLQKKAWVFRWSHRGNVIQQLVRLLCWRKKWGLSLWMSPHYEHSPWENHLKRGKKYQRVQSMVYVTPWTWMRHQGGGNMWQMRALHIITVKDQRGDRKMSDWQDDSKSSSPVLQLSSAWYGFQKFPREYHQSNIIYWLAL